MKQSGSFRQGLDRLKAKQVAAFCKKRRKNFLYSGPEAFARHGPKLQKFFCYFLFTKSSLSSFLSPYGMSAA
jgi:hypothetical protein